MTADITHVNYPTIAPLRNVAALTELVERVMGRAHGLPGMATFHGSSGRGKSFAATYAANRHRAYHVQMKSVWTRKHFCLAILREMGLSAAKTIPEMVDQIGEQLSISNRVLIVDEADHLVTKNMIEVVRDIYESSWAGIVLVGEETLPVSLKRWERVHGRMIDWVEAQPASLADCKALARIYARGIDLAEDLLVDLHEASAGSVRRCCVNLDRVAEEARTAGKTVMTRADYTRDFFTGNPPPRRS